MADSLSDLVRAVWEKMRLAGEAGSLLKIEEELQDAIRKGQDEWEERLPLFRFTEYGLSEEPRERLVRFVPGDVEDERTTFWDKAEGLVREPSTSLSSMPRTEGDTRGNSSWRTPNRDLDSWTFVVIAMIQF